MPLILDNARLGLKIPRVSLNISLARQLSALNSKGSSYRRLRFILTRTRSAVPSVRKLGGLKENNIWMSYHVIVTSQNPASCHFSGAVLTFPHFTKTSENLRKCRT